MEPLGFGFFCFFGPRWWTRDSLPGSIINVLLAVKEYQGPKP